MKGRVKKAVIIITLFLTPFTFAKRIDSEINKIKMYNTSAGCMSCHQSETASPNDSVDNQHNNAQ